MILTTINDLVKIIRNPSSCSAEHVVILKEIVQKYPYFQIVHALIAKEAAKRDNSYKAYSL